MSELVTILGVTTLSTVSSRPTKPSSQPAQVTSPEITSGQDRGRTWERSSTAQRRATVSTTSAPAPTATCTGSAPPEVERARGGRDADARREEHDDRDRNEDERRPARREQRGRQRARGRVSNRQAREKAGDRREGGRGVLERRRPHRGDEETDREPDQQRADRDDGRQPGGCPQPGSIQKLAVLDGERGDDRENRDRRDDREPEMRHPWRLPPHGNSRAPQGDPGHTTRGAARKRRPALCCCGYYTVAGISYASSP